MNITKETTDQCEVILTVEIDEQQQQKLLQKAARRIAKAVKIPGFRPGKAPYNIVVSRIGEDAIREEAVKDLTTTVYQDAVKEADVTPFAPALMDDIQWEPLVMKIHIPTEPVVELGNYRDVRVEAELVEVTDDEITVELERLKERFVTINPVERPAQTGDVVSVSVVETEAGIDDAEADTWERDIELADGEKAEDGTPDYVAHLLGKAVDETVEFSHTFPEDFFDDELKGKTFNYAATVKEIKEKEDLPLDDDFASLVGDYDSLDELIAKIREDLQTQKTLRQESKLTDEALGKIIAGSTIKWHQTLEEQELKDAVQRQVSELKRYGIDYETFLKIQKKSAEEFREDLRESVQNNLRNALALGKIVELEKISVDNADIMQEASHVASISENPDRMAEVVYSESGQRVIANNLLTEKALRRLLAIAKGEAEVEETDDDAENEPVAETPATAEIEETPADADTAETDEPGE